MAEFRDMDKVPQKCPQNGGFLPFVNPKDFLFRKSCVTLYFYGAINSCKTRQVYYGPRVVKFISVKSKKKLSQKCF